MTSPARSKTKRFMDIVGSITLILVLLPIFIILFIVSFILFFPVPLFKQIRVGQYAKLFNLYKFRTSNISTDFQDHRTNLRSKYGYILNKYKLNELPQLFQVLIGKMSLVGPRPDLPGFADLLTGDERIILKLKPGVTGPATIKYKTEVDILKNQLDPKEYNKNVIWPDKVRLNLEYYYSWSLKLDAYYLWKTIS